MSEYVFRCNGYTSTRTFTTPSDARRAGRGGGCTHEHEVLEVVWEAGGWKYRPITSAVSSDGNGRLTAEAEREGAAEARQELAAQAEQRRIGVQP
jgi:hypothetical protein